MLIARMRRCVAVVVALCLFASAAEAASFGLALHRVDASQFPSVRTYVSVANSDGVPFADLNAESFEVLEDDKPVADLKVEPFAADQEPIAVGLLIDVSGSMADANKMGSAKQAATAFVDTLEGKSVASVYRFADQVDQVQDFTDDKNALKAAIAKLAPKGDTVLYDSIARAAQEIARRPEQRRALIILTDGEDTKSKQSLDASIAAAKAAGAPVYAVGLGKDVKRDILDRVGSATAGQAVYVLAPGELAKVFVSIGDQLRRQYLIQYTSRIIPDDLPHTVTVRAKRNGETVEAKGSFTPKRTVLGLEVKGLAESVEARKSQEIEVAVAGGTAQQVELVVDDQVRAVASAAPFVLEWDVGKERPGLHKVAVRAKALDGNITIEEFSVEVIAPTPTPTRTPTPTATPLPPTPAPTPAPEPAPPAWPGPLLYALGGFVVLGALGGGTWSVLARRRRRWVPPEEPTRPAPKPVRTEAARRPSDGGDSPERPTLGEHEVPKARLHVSHQGSERDVAIDQPETVLGRETTNPVVIRDPMVSRRHARIVVERGEFWIEDLQSLHGTRVNGELVARRRLVSNDQIRIGEAVITFTVEPSPHGRSSQGPRSGETP